MTEQQNIERIQQIYGAFGRGDIPTVLGALSADVTWVNAGPADISYFGTHKGPNAVANGVFGFIGANFEFTAFDPHTFFANGDQVVALLHVAGKARTTGKTFDQETAHVFTLRGGQISHFRDIQDTAAVAGALRA